MRTVIIIAIIILLMSGITYKVATGGDEKEALKMIAQKYGKPVAQTIERMFRLETSHFKSLAFKKTNAAGMQATKPVFPYGWTSFASFWNDESIRPTGLTTLKDNHTGEAIQFLVFPSIYAGMVVMAEYLKNHRPGNWNSNLVAAQDVYENKLNSIIPRITNTFA